MFARPRTRTAIKLQHCLLPRLVPSRWTRQVLVPPPSPKFRTAHRFLCRSLSFSPRTRPIELADIASQLQVLMSSTQSVMTTVGQLGGQMRSLQAEVTEMKNADNRDDEDFDEHHGFQSDFALRAARICQICAILSHVHGWASVPGPPTQPRSSVGGPPPLVADRVVLLVFHAHEVIRACQPTTIAHAGGGSSQPKEIRSRTL